MYVQTSTRDYFFTIIPRDLTLSIPRLGFSLVWDEPLAVSLDQNNGQIYWP